MDAQIISIFGQIAGVTGGLGVIIWLVVYTTRDVQAGRVRDRESSDRRIGHLEAQIQELTQKVDDLTAEVKAGNEALEKRNADLDAARTAINDKDLQIVRLRTVIIKHGWEGDLDEL